MQVYNFHKREQNISWSINQMKTLLTNAEKFKSSSFIIYAALEGRLIIERIEFELLIMAAHNSLDNSWKKIIESYKGIQKANSKYKALKYRYQSFTEAFSKTAVNGPTIKPFDFKKSEVIQARLSKYIHVYSKTNNELMFESEFMQQGIILVEETISFLENMFTLHNGKYILSIIDFSTLKNGFETEFENWIKAKDTDVEALTNRLREIVNNKK